METRLVRYANVIITAAAEVFISSIRVKRTEKTGMVLVNYASDENRLNSLSHPGGWGEFDSTVFSDHSVYTCTTMNETCRPTWEVMSRKIKERVFNLFAK